MAIFNSYIQLPKGHQLWSKLGAGRNGETHPQNEYSNREYDDQPVDFIKKVILKYVEYGWIWILQTNPPPEIAERTPHILLQLDIYEHIILWSSAGIIVEHM